MLLTFHTADPNLTLPHRSVVLPQTLAIVEGYISLSCVVCIIYSAVIPVLAVLSIPFLYFSPCLPLAISPNFTSRLFELSHVLTLQVNRSSTPPSLCTYPNLTKSLASSNQSIPLALNLPLLFSPLPKSNESLPFSS